MQGLLNQVPENTSTIFLQYSNYPYLLGKLDAPMWLVDALKVLKQKGVRIVMMFHELSTLRYKQIRCPNFGQRWGSRGLTQVADVVVTNNTAFQRTEAGWTQAPVRCVTNFSTIGERGKVKPLSRWWCLVVAIAPAFTVTIRKYSIIFHSPTPFP